VVGGDVAVVVGASVAAGEVLAVEAGGSGGASVVGACDEGGVTPVSAPPVPPVSVVSQAVAASAITASTASVRGRGFDRRAMISISIARRAQFALAALSR
jgi:hypothetical protein